MPDATLTLIPDEDLGTLSPLLHGQFAEHLGRCCVDGLWVGRDSEIPNTGGFRDDVVEALAELEVPLLRWPGGCYADSYHWEDGIGDPDQRPRSLGESCGLSVVEDNGLGTHEFIDLCREIGAKPYLAGNVGSGSPRELSEWVQYCNESMDTTLARRRGANGHFAPMNVRYWGVGNENWGCGGNYDAADYAKEFRRYATFLKMADPTIELVACGGEPDWNVKVAETLRGHPRFLDHFSIHRYYNAGPAVGFSDDDYYQSMGAGQVVEKDIRTTYEILQSFSGGHRTPGIALDEWGIWHPEAVGGGGYQAPNTLRDAIAAAGVLDVLHRWCRTVSMANLAQIVNVLQCLIETDEDRMCLTPTYHVFGLNKVHRRATVLRAEVECSCIDTRPLITAAAESVPLLSATASTKDGHLAVTLTNRHLSHPMEVQINWTSAGPIHVETLTSAAASDTNTPASPDRVGITSTKLSSTGPLLTIVLPPRSVQTLYAAGRM